MGANFSPSKNIIRDAEQAFDYIPTPNVQRLAKEIFLATERGTRSFSLVGSYGTGKSSFLVALDHSLKGSNLLEIDTPTLNGYQPLRLIGSYESFRVALSKALGGTARNKTNWILKTLKQQAASGELWIYTDEFGKYLEFASKNAPEEELYFIQELAEFVNDPSNKCVWLLTLHQNFEAYGASSRDVTLRDEWKKVRGRLHELGFNEPVEQLLYLASRHLENSAPQYVDRETLAYENGLLNIDPKSIGTFQGIAPLDLVSGGVLAKALQVYGQNERSLFTFLFSGRVESTDWFRVDHVYDYLLDAFYTDIHSPHNPFYRQWQAMRDALERALSLRKHGKLGTALLKTIGLLQLFSSKSAQIDSSFLATYFKGFANEEQVSKALKALSNAKLIVYARYAESYHISQGTDVDFDQALSNALAKVEDVARLSDDIKQHFNFEVVQAKRESYSKGTPRLYQYVVTDDPIEDFTAIGAIDGAINLVFNDQPQKKYSLPSDVPVAYALFRDAASIRNSVRNIKAAKLALAEFQDDPIARTEFKRILAGFENDLKVHVLDALFEPKLVNWYCLAKKERITNAKAMNVMLSNLSKAIFPNTPTLRNELFNKHKISTSIHTARKGYFEALVQRDSIEEFGFEGDRIPPERAIIQTLVVRNGMHKKSKGQWKLNKPSSKYGFDVLWEKCTTTLNTSIEGAIPISRFWDVLRQKPFGLKQGLMDFWIPTFLYANRSEFALYQDDRFVPDINEATLYLMTRTPQAFKVKAFEISGKKLEIFNRYREILHLEDTDRMTSEGFVESIKPFLVFYRTLNEYARRTTRISIEAQRIRQAISKAKDPESLFFETIPEALGIDITELANSPDQTAAFAKALNDRIRELRLTFPELLNRWEAFIAKDVLGGPCDFEVYKSNLAQAYSGIDSSLLTQGQRVLVDRFQSPIQDRDSWLASIAQAVLNKPIEKFSDEDELRLRKGFRHRIAELNNLVELHALSIPEDATAVKLDITNLQGSKSRKVIIHEKDQTKVSEAVTELQTQLRKYNGLRDAILATLLNDELND